MSAANTKKTEKKSIFVPKLPNSKHQPPLEGSVNGKAFLLPRGKTSEVPPEVYEVVKRSIDGEDRAEEYYNGIQAELFRKAEAEAEGMKR